ncbi:5-methylcytosine-specific restriction enzyme A [Arthrobacter sp. cf158]|uniref:hypothetical protein n=1 Tax=Arthrobacter sp. cf158 TaxID=1761744 RepID=UPI00089D9454|nr:hypothetical protein [Arthrobacter sp. cf158]SDW33781.1 5-methylcytosine-specific restriction enzyme A [Arthrobacter sp. cf158]
MTIPWGTPVGWTSTRAEISELYGGSSQGGMVTSRKSPNVFIFSDPEEGHKHGYQYDGWADGGSIFYYTGMGDDGAQRMWLGNKAARDHRADGKAIRLFAADGIVPGTKKTKRQVYLGEFEVDTALPYSVEDAPDKFGVARTVFVFNLRPVGRVLRRSQDNATSASKLSKDWAARRVPLEEHTSDTFTVPEKTQGIALKREQALVKAFQTVLEARGHDVGRFAITPPGASHVLMSDIHDFTDSVLYEAKAEATRNNIRTGLGQMLDYRRGVSVERCRILLPAKPAGDLLELLRDHGIDTVWREAESSQFWLYSKGLITTF